MERVALQGGDMWQGLTHASNVLGNAPLYDGNTLAKDHHVSATLDP